MLASSTVQTPPSTDSASWLLTRLAARTAEGKPRPRVLGVFAHPDDEVLAVGSRMEQFGRSLFLVVTDGAPADGVDARAHGFGSVSEYREARREELRDALVLAGLPETFSGALLLDPGDRTSQLPDKEAMYHLVALTRAVVREMCAFRPEAVLTHPFEGGHPDHDSCAFACRAAARLLGESAPPVLEAPSYHAGPDGHIRTNVFLPSESAIYVAFLSNAEQEAKRARLACFRSQQQTLAQFSLEKEQFRRAPAYDFRLQPNASGALYESFGWGLAAADFSRCATAALAELGLVPGPGEESGRVQ